MREEIREILAEPRKPIPQEKVRVSLIADTREALLEIVGRDWVVKCKAKSCTHWFLPVRRTQEYCSFKCAHLKSSVVVDTEYVICKFCDRTFNRIKPKHPGATPYGGGCKEHCRDFSLLKMLTETNSGELKRALMDWRAGNLLAKVDKSLTSQEYRNVRACAKFGIKPEDIDMARLAAVMHLCYLCRQQWRDIDRTYNHGLKDIIKEKGKGVRLEEAKRLAILAPGGHGWNDSINIGIQHNSLKSAWKRTWTVFGDTCPKGVRGDMFIWMMERAKYLRNRGSKDTDQVREWETIANELEGTTKNVSWDKRDKT